MKLIESYIDCKTIKLLNSNNLIESVYMYSHQFIIMYHLNLKFKHIRKSDE